MKRAILMQAVLALLLGGVGKARANLIVNGGFETGDFTGWMVHANFGSDDIIVGAVPYFGAGSTAANGNFVAAFNANNSPPPGELSQILATTAGQTYLVQYDYGTTIGGPQELGVIVFNSGGYILGVQLPAAVASNPPSALTHFSFQFTADGSQANLVFYDSSTNTASNVDGVLDNVNVSALSAIPEPSTLILLGLGSLGLLGFSRRRRKQAKEW